MNAVGKKVVLIEDPDYGREDAGMEFRLTYEDLVYPSGNKKEQA
ncbi:MAG TPA: hypothetical protein VFY87_28845 [Geminicoccaceae bacterium]|nr:hypothetical protein [Geminicoccaceae bacterium]